MAVDNSRVAALVHAVLRPGCDAFHVRHQGEVLIDVTTERGQEAIETMSVTKAVVGMVVCRLLSQGLLDTIDRPLTEFVPEWRGTAKEAITLWHVMEHTSGLAAHRTTEEIFASEDFVRLAIEAELITPPGRRFFYNNRAVNLLAAVVLQVSGRRMDHYAAAELFESLGIYRWGWTLDRAGNPHCKAGLQLRACDLATLGQLMLQGGSWKGAEVLAREWVEASTSRSAVAGTRGLMWSLAGGQRAVITDAVVDPWRRALPPVDEAFIARVLPLKNRPMARPEILRRPQSHVRIGRRRASGVASQHLATQPPRRLIPPRVTAFYADVCVDSS